MTLTEAGEIFRYWEDNPPAHLLLQTIARLLGWQPARASPAASLADLAARPRNRPGRHDRNAAADPRHRHAARPQPGTLGSG